MFRQPGAPGGEAISARVNKGSSVQIPGFPGGNGTGRQTGGRTGHVR
jgi:hypothetical protein